MPVCGMVGGGNHEQGIRLSYHVLHSRPEGRDELRQVHGYHPPIQADVEDVEAPQGIVKICPQCGKEFTQGKITQKIYCSFECQKAHAQSAAYRRYHDRKNKELEVHE